MSWDTRNAAAYYYAKFREGGKLRTIYYGRDERAQLISSMMERRRRRRIHERRESVARAKAEARYESILIKYCRDLDSIVSSHMYVCGYHCHRSRWRRNGPLNRRRMKLEGFTTLDQLIVAERARQQDATATVLRLTDLYNHAGADEVMAMVVDHVSADEEDRRALLTHADQLISDLSGNDTSEVVGLLAERVVVTHLDAAFVHQLHAQANEAQYCDQSLVARLGSRRSRASRRFRNALKGLALVAQLNAQVVLDTVQADEPFQRG